ISSRTAWESFFQQMRGLQGYSSAEFDQLLAVIDKMGRQSDEQTEQELQPLRVAVDDVKRWIAEWNQKIFDRDSVSGNTALALLHQMLHEYLLPRDLLDYVSVDFGVVRGLAYYTDLVFEVFDRSGKFRAVAGGGRYDGLIAQLSDRAVSLPALGFAMGDVVLSELINEIPRAREAMQKAIASDRKIDICVVIAKEERRADAHAQIQQLRDRGYRVDYPMTPTKVARQFQAAEEAGAALALLYGDEWPQVKVKNLPTREESLIDHGALLDSVAKFFNVGSSA